MLFFHSRYPTVSTTELLGTDGPEGVGETRPCVLCEYSHAMGNSNGNLHKYWEVGVPMVYCLLCSAGWGCGFSPSRAFVLFFRLMSFAHLSILPVGGDS